MVDRLFDAKREQTKRELAELAQIEDEAVLEQIAKDAETCSQYQPALLRLQGHGLTHLDDEALEELEKTVKASLEETEKAEAEKKDLEENRKKKRLVLFDKALLYTFVASIITAGGYLILRGEPELEQTLNQPSLYNLNRTVEKIQTRQEQELRNRLNNAANTDCRLGISVADFLAFYENATDQEFPISMPTEEENHLHFYLKEDLEGIEVRGFRDGYKLSLSPQTAEKLIQRVGNPCKVEVE